MEFDPDEVYCETCFEALSDDEAGAGTTCQACDVAHRELLMEYEPLLGR